VIRPRPKTLLLAGACLCAAALGCAQSPTRVSSSAPVLNFRLPYWTPEGHRAWLVRGSEARLISDEEVDIKELTLTVFAGDASERVQTVLLSPTAKVLRDEQVASGDDSLRVINDRIEAAGLGWRYDHKGKKVSIFKNVRVTIRSELKDLLK